MNEFKNKVAVVTGAASGIGRALAARCALEGMKIVLADVEEDALYRAADELGRHAAGVLAVRTDVSDPEQVEALCDRTLREFGAAHLLFNNAGVGAGVGPIWQTTAADWQWVIGVNLMGVAHGIRSFVPVMLRQDSECHIVNTASISGLLSSAHIGLYGVSKHAVVSMSESLYNELRLHDDRIGVSVLCPGFVRTGIMDSARNRPASLPDGGPASGPWREATMNMRDRVEQGMEPEQLAAIVFDAIREQRFYIISHPETKEWVDRRAEDILAGRNPRVHQGWRK